MPLRHVIMVSTADIHRNLYQKELVSGIKCDNILQDKTKYVIIFLIYKKYLGSDRKREEGSASIILCHVF